MKKAIVISALLHIAFFSAIFFLVGNERSSTSEKVAAQVFVTEGASVSADLFKEHSAAAAEEPDSELSYEAKQEAAISAQYPSEPSNTEARLENPVNPPYPPLSRRNSEQGKVDLMLEIDTEGKVTVALVEKSSGFPRLDEAARATLSEARFIPANRNGLAVLASKRLTVEFRLTD